MRTVYLIIVCTIAICVMSGCSRNVQVSSRYELDCFNPRSIDLSKIVTVYDKTGKILLPETEYFEGLLLTRLKSDDDVLNITIVIEESALTATMIPSMITCCIIPGVIGINGGAVVNTVRGKYYSKFQLRRMVWLPNIIIDEVKSNWVDDTLTIARYHGVYFDWKLLEELLEILSRSSIDK